MSDPSGEKKLILSIGCGNTNVECRLASENRGANIIAVDEYDPKVAVYRETADMFDNLSLPAQTEGHPTLAVLRSGVGMLSHLPDDSIDHVLLVSPEGAAFEDLISYLWDKGCIRKMKTGGSIIIKPHPKSIALSDRKGDNIGQLLRMANVPAVPVDVGEMFLGVPIDSVSGYPSGDHCYKISVQDLQEIISSGPRINLLDKKLDDVKSQTDMIRSKFGDEVASIARFFLVGEDPARGMAEHLIDHFCRRKSPGLAREDAGKLVLSLAEWMSVEGWLSVRDRGVIERIVQSRCGPITDQMTSLFSGRSEESKTARDIASDLWDDLLLWADDAAKRGENVVIALDESVIPDKRGRQGTIHAELLSELKKLPAKFRKVGVKNVIFKSGTGTELAGELKTFADTKENNTPYRNIVVIGPDSILDASTEDKRNPFEELKNEKGDERALLAGLDLGFCKNMLKMDPETIGIDLFYMFDLAINLAAGQTIEDLKRHEENIKIVEDPAGRPRMFRFSPVKPYDMETFRAVLDAQIRVINTKA
jgi:hypothetical protein